MTFDQSMKWISQKLLCVTVTVRVYIDVSLSVSLVSVSTIREWTSSSTVVDMTLDRNLILSNGLKLKLTWVINWKKKNRHEQTWKTFIDTDSDTSDTQ